MIYYSFNFVDSFSNATGNKRSKMVLGELGKIIRTNPNEVRLALQEADINVPAKTSDKELIRLILKNKRNRRMITNLSVLIYASARFDGGGEYEEFFGRRNKGADSSGGGDKNGILAKVGEWISTRKERKAQRQAEGGDKKNVFQKIGSFFNKNKEQIGDVASSLADGLQNNAQSSKEVMTANLKTSSSSVSETQAKQGMSKNTKNALIIGGIILVGALFYWKQKNK
jgi:hypothetical protein